MSCPRLRIAPQRLIEAGHLPGHRPTHRLRLGQAPRRAGLAFRAGPGFTLTLHKSPDPLTALLHRDLLAHPTQSCTGLLHSAAECCPMPCQLPIRRPSLNLLADLEAGVPSGQFHRLEVLALLNERVHRLVPGRPRRRGQVHAERLVRLVRQLGRRLRPQVGDRDRRGVAQRPAAQRNVSTT